MNLKEFISKYSLETERGWSEYLFNCAFEEDEGFILPEGFYLDNAISRIPIFMIAVNREEKAVIKYNGQVSLSIYDSEVQMNAAIGEHCEYYQQRYEEYLNFQKFCERITKLEFMEVIDAITIELHEIDRVIEDNKKKKIYMENLMVLLRLFMGTTVPQNGTRDNFIRDAYPLLRKLESNLISVQSMNLVKISDVHHSKSDDTFYVSNRDYVNSYEYITDDLEKTRRLLTADGWDPCGVAFLGKSSFADMLNRDSKYIAIWEGVEK